MAARIRRQHQDEVRAKIQGSQLINRLQDHALGTVEMTATQVAAAKCLLDKLISNAPTEITGEDGKEIPLVHNKRPQLTKEEWLAAHGLATSTGPAE